MFGSPLIYLIMFAPLGLVMWLGMGIQNIFIKSENNFYVFAALMGLSLSSILLTYTGASVARAFITAGAFAGLSVMDILQKRFISFWSIFSCWGYWFITSLNC